MNWPSFVLGAFVAFWVGVLVGVKQEPEPIVYNFKHFVCITYKEQMTCYVIERDATAQPAPDIGITELSLTRPLTLHPFSYTEQF